MFHNELITLVFRFGHFKKLIVLESCKILQILRSLKHVKFSLIIYKKCFLRKTSALAIFCVVCQLKRLLVSRQSLNSTLTRLLVTKDILARNISHILLSSATLVVVWMECSQYLDSRVFILVSI